MNRPEDEYRERIRVIQKQYPLNHTLGEPPLPFALFIVKDMEGHENALSCNIKNERLNQWKDNRKTINQHNK